MTRLGRRLASQGARTVGPLLGASLVAVVLAGPLEGQERAASRSGAPRAAAVYDALRAMRPDGRSVAVSALELSRDAFTFRFDEGTFHFLDRVEGATVGAVFLGRGTVQLAPFTTAEKRHLGRVTGEAGLETLTDTFDEMVLLFLDGTDYDVRGDAEVAQGGRPTEATAVYERFLELQRKELHTNFQLRLLEDLVNDSGWQQGLFLAFFDGARTPPALAAFDPRGCDALRLRSNWSRERAFLVVLDDDNGGFWYSSDPRRAKKGSPRLDAPDWGDAHHYDVELRIQSGTAIAARATIRLASRVPRLEALPIHLLPTLRIHRVAMRRQGDGEAWTEGAFVQEDARHDGDATLLLPTPLAKDEIGEIRVEYAGDGVLEPAGDDNFMVNARTSWYPNLGPFRDVATYRLTFDLPLGLQVVAVGREIESRDDGQRHLQVWESKEPIKVAGFNYGKFVALTEQDGATSTEVAVYTTTGRPEILDYIEAALRSGNRSGRDASDSVEMSPQEEAVAALGRQGLVGAIDSSQLARSALVDGMNTGRIAAAYFGPLPYSRVAITQQSQWTFGQSWPGLIYMPYLAFLANVHRMQIGELMPRGFVSDAQVAHIGYHEYAHQWWGHLVGWDSYRDQWLSEGFAEFTAGLVAEHVKGRDAADAFWAAARDRIVEKPRGGKIPNYQAGPVSLGYRLAARGNSAAPGALIYSKGAYILHMLRMMMWENQGQPPDHRFIAMMRDFTSSFAGKAATSADFQKVVERHLLPQMDATGDGSMDWFFDQWLYGTEMPSFKSDLALEKVGGDQYRIAGTVGQSGVSETFRSFVPLYVDFGKDGLARLGGVMLAGTAPLAVDIPMRLPAKPKRVLLNAHHDVLALEVK